MKENGEIVVFVVEAKTVIKKVCAGYILRVLYGARRRGIKKMTKRVGESYAPNVNWKKILLDA